MNVLRHDIETGQETALFHTPAAGYTPSPRVSPDDQWFAYRSPDPADTSQVALMVRPVNGGATRTLFSAEWLTALWWTPDGRYILFKKGRGSATSNLWRVSVETGEARKLGLQRDNLRLLRIHPDGKQVVFRIEENKAEIWVMEDFLPEDGGTK